MAVLVMLNNYLPDLATAVFAVSTLAAYFLRRSPAMRDAPVSVRALAMSLVRVGIFSLGWVLLGGVIRALTYRRYEWVEAAGRDQVTALAVKHVILVCLVIAGLVALFGLRRGIRAGESDEEIR